MIMQRTAATQRKGAGGLQVLITCQKPDSGATPDNFNEVDLSNNANWTTHATFRADVRAASGSERFGDDQVVATRNLIITTIANATTAAIKADHRLTWTDRFGLSHTANVVEAHVSGLFMVLSCLEDTSA